ncbi:MAG TPA: matrixin family metalloprotease [Polyangiaceae bacterium]|nr:matrixin family metalloprotease [Polyangiaceae bacterium]
MKRRARAGVVALLLATPQVALAFCPAKTCDPSVPEQHCEVDALTKCVTSGESLFWSSNCVTFSIQKDAAPSAGISYSDIEASVKRGFVAWTKADCGGKSPSLRLTLSEPVSCDASEYNLKAKNANVIVFREDEWPYEGAEDALGLTRVRFDTDVNVGELFDADIELNAVSEPLAVGQPKTHEVDLDSLVTHELGHALGLAHSLDSGSTMLAGYTKGSTNARTLGDDDVAGVCETYPPERKAASSSCEPRHGFSELCGADQPIEAPSAPGGAGSASDDSANESSGCTFAPPCSTSARHAIWLLGASICAGVFWLRRRRAPRALRPMLVAPLGLLHTKPASAETPCSWRCRSA